MAPWRDGRLAPSLSEVDYEDAVQSILDKHGVDLIQVRSAKRSLGPILAARMEIAKTLKNMGVGAKHTARLLNCSEWSARFYYDINTQERKRRKYAELARRRDSPPSNHIERKLAEGPQMEGAL